MRSGCCGSTDSPGEHDQTVAQLQQLYAGWAEVDIGIEVPAILESGLRNGRSTPSTGGSPDARSHLGWPAPAKGAA